VVVSASIVHFSSRSASRNNDANTEYRDEGTAAAAAAAAVSGERANAP